MQDKELFNIVLGEGEEILKTYRPHKFRAFFTQILSWVLLLLLVGICCWGMSVDGDSSTTASIIVILSIFVVCAVVSLVLTGMWCKKTVYAITNKRVLIRTGRIGVDYKSLDFSMLGAITVNVTWVDKLLHKNTGLIAFGSMSSPLTTQGVAKFAFNFIQNPYEVYKEVKAIIDSNKKEN